MLGNKSGEQFKLNWENIFLKNKLGKHQSAAKIAIPNHAHPTQCADNFLPSL